jgi:hypothetical protein
MTNPDRRHRLRAARRRLVLAAAGLGAVVLAAGLSACSHKSGQSAPTSSTPAAQPSATPSESGDLTTRIAVHDDSASITLALSDEKPPSVDSFAISLKTGSGQYQLPYQAPESASQVLATKDGTSYTVTGSGQGTSPTQGDVHQVTFGIHVTCP